MRIILSSQDFYVWKKRGIWKFLSWHHTGLHLLYLYIPNHTSQACPSNGTLIRLKGGESQSQPFQSPIGAVCASAMLFVPRQYYFTALPTSVLLWWASHYLTVFSVDLAGFSNSPASFFFHYRDCHHALSDVYLIGDDIIGCYDYDFILQLLVSTISVFFSIEQ